MTYVFLTLKRVFKNKLNYIPFFFDRNIHSCYVCGHP